eukprot:TRINITY_DN5445_c0_g1_i1.p1 TRINITY_DN5445_c0_g1~~TRINITY_DN5445_c0_g1_i1.p1  ORF type:complete len:365 (+),score=39.96 TRINITY_DN5445_c0_g1_i1:43-1137(+)
MRDTQHKFFLLATIWLVYISCQTTYQKPEVVWVPSPNFSERNCSGCALPHTIDGIAIHTTEETTERTLEIFLNINTTSSASAHYVITPNGTIIQMVNDSLRAWTTTYVNSRSIGIELVGWAGSSKSFTYPLLGSLTKLLAFLVSEYSIPLKHPNSTAFDFPVKTDYGYFNESGIYGHFQVQTCGSNAVIIGGYGCKNDPGPFFPWDQIMENVGDQLNLTVQNTEQRHLTECEYITQPNDTLIGISNKFKLYYWQNLCIANPNALQDICDEQCVVFSKCDNTKIPHGVPIKVVGVVEEYGVTCTSWDGSNFSESSSGSDMKHWYFIGFWVLLGLLCLLLVGLLVLLIGVIVYAKKHGIGYGYEEI